MEEYLAGFIHAEGTLVEWSSCAFRAGTTTGVQIRVGLRGDIDLVQHAVGTSVIDGVSCADIFLLDLPDTQQQNEDEDISQDGTTLPTLYRSLQINGPEDSYRRPTPLLIFSFIIILLCMYVFLVWRFRSYSESQETKIPSRGKPQY